LSRVFIDTSAVFALLVPTDQAHERACRIFDRLRAREAVLITTSYSLVETNALLERRFGRSATAAFRSDFAPLLDIVWVDEDLHERGLDLLLQRPSGLSLVDAVSFIIIRDRKLDEVFAFDRHFELEGFPMAGGEP
jgi:predicted nucleic acid-binding protein